MSNMCNAVVAVVLGVVRLRSPGVVTVVTPAPASCMVHGVDPGLRAVVKLWTRFERLAEIPK